MVSCSLPWREVTVLIIFRYKHLPARQVDLVGDYAGNELFVIHGESVLLHCFENDEVDFDGNFSGFFSWTISIMLTCPSSWVSIVACSTFS